MFQAHLLRKGADLPPFSDPISAMTPWARRLLSSLRPARQCRCSQEGPYACSEVAAPCPTLIDVSRHRPDRREAGKAYRLIDKIACMQLERHIATQEFQLWKLSSMRTSQPTSSAPTAATPSSRPSTSPPQISRCPRSSSTSSTTRYCCRASIDGDGTRAPLPRRSPTA